MRKMLGFMLMMLPMIAVAQSGMNGNWKIDLNKAQLDAKPQVFELKDGMYSCSTCDPKISVKADGTEQKVSGSPYIDSIKVTVKDKHTVDQVGMKDGKVVYHSVWTLSPDGNMLSEKYEGHPEGSDQAVMATAMYSRVGEPEHGAHMLSGSWKIDHYQGVSDNALTFNYTVSPEGVHYQASTGESYDAKFDGQDYPYHGDPGTTSISLKKISDNSFEETYKRNGEVVGMATMTLNPDGSTMTIEAHDKRRGTTDNLVAVRNGNGSTMAGK